MNLNEFKDSLFDQLPLITWEFDVNDTSSIFGNWPKEWQSLKDEMKYIYSFTFSYKSQQFLCILAPTKERISITIEDSIHKDKLYKLISNLKLNIDWSKIDEEIIDLDKKRNELMSFKLKLKADLIKSKSNLTQNHDNDPQYLLARRDIREKFIASLKQELLKFDIKCVAASFGRSPKGIFWSISLETRDGLYPLQIQLPENFEAHSNESFQFIIENITKE